MQGDVSACKWVTNTCEGCADACAISPDTMADIDAVNIYGISMLAFDACSPYIFRLLIDVMGTVSGLASRRLTTDLVRFWLAH